MFVRIVPSVGLDGFLVTRAQTGIQRGDDDSFGSACGYRRCGCAAGKQFGKKP